MVLSSHIFRKIAGILFLLSMASCSKNNPAKPEPVVRDTTFTAHYSTTSLKISHVFYLSDTAWLEAPDLKEISGMVHSSSKAISTFWTEEDNGNKSAIYLLNTKGELTGEKFLSGIFNRDWEDIAGGPGPDKGKYYIYIGDIGDNLQIFPFITVFRFIEPNPEPGQWKDSFIHHFSAINMVYPNGPHNAEALMVDPLTKNIYILTKGDSAVLYVNRYPQNTHKVTTLEKSGTLPLSSVTAADISPDGSQILIKNYDNIYYWKRKRNESIAKCLQRTPLRLDYHREYQGESVAWGKQGKGFYTLSEQVGNHIPVLYHYVSH